MSSQKIKNLIEIWFRVQSFGLVGYAHTQYDNRKIIIYHFNESISLNLNEVCKYIIEWRILANKKYSFKHLIYQSH
jgi:hypothetical protein